MLENTKGAIKKMDNPEKLATFGTQDTGPRKTKQKTTYQALQN